MQTLFIITAVAIGVAVIVFMSAMLASLQANFLRRVLTSQPHIQLIPPDEVARPLRRSSPTQVVAGVIQRPVQRIRSIDQWQTIRDQLTDLARDYGRITDHERLGAGLARRRQALHHPQRHRSRHLLPDRAHPRLHRARQAARFVRRHPYRHRARQGSRRHRRRQAQRLLGNRGFAHPDRSGHLRSRQQGSQRAIHLRRAANGAGLAQSPGRGDDDRPHRQ